MPRRINLDSYLQNYEALTPRQRDMVVQLVIRQAKADRAAANRALLRAARRRSWALTQQGWRLLRRLGVPLRSLFDAGWHRHLTRRHRREAAARLYEMDDRMLKDIGLRRSEIEFALSGVEDPTRIPRRASRRSDPLEVLRPKPVKNPLQRAATPLLLRNSCAG
jgi:hypothetical protein